MRQFSKDILHSTNISKTKVIVFTVLWTTLWCGISISKLHHSFMRQSSWPIDFSVREYLHQGPSVHPQLKVFAFDDSTLASLNRAHMSIEEWARLIQFIAASQPKIILIDKIFGVPDVTPGQEKKQQFTVEALLKNLKVPVVAGAFVAPKQLKYRSPLKLNHADYDVNRIVRAGVNSPSILFHRDGLSIPKAVGATAYGPYESLRPMFRHIGHIQYDNSFRLAPFFRLGAKNVLPHFGIFVSDQYQYRGSFLYINDKVVPTLNDGWIPVNFVSPPTLFDKIRSIQPILQTALNNSASPSPQINKGDVVVLLPMMYTGNTDFKETPFGPLPAAFAHLSFVNSIMNADWIKPIDNMLMAIIITAMIAGSLCFIMDHFWLFGIGMLLNSVYMSVGIGLFSYQSLSLPWLYLVLTNTCIIVTGVTLKARFFAAKSALLRSALDGALSPSALNEVLRRRKEIHLDAREHVITIMFIDVVGYSLLAENQIPRVAFDQLKILLAHLTEEVHAFGGMVNKTLGDGLMCLYGYDFEKDAVTTDHAEKAVACAISIQEKNLRYNLRASKRKEPVYPLRIGIHTASVFLGDLGNGERIDFTAVGNGVNFAKRMEQACEIHSVLFSSTTKDLIASLALSSDGLRKKMITIKHHTNQIEAYEYDPFHKYPEVRVQAIDAYRQCASLARIEQRFTIAHPDMYEISSSVGQAHLINFSAAGLSLKLKAHLVKGSSISINLESIDGKLGKQLKELGIAELKAEVRWCYTETDGSVHGLIYRNLTEAQALSLVDCLKAFDLALKLSRQTGKIAS